MEHQTTKERGHAPLWGWVLVGWLAAGGVVAWAARSSGPAPEAQAAAQAAEMNWDLETMSPRELRTLPDIGTKRAVEIADQRWEGKLDEPAAEATRGTGINLQRVPGIGPRTDRSVRRFIRQRRMPPGMLPHDVPPLPRQHRPPSSFPALAQ